MAIVNGVAIGVVTAVQPGQVKLHFPWLNEPQHETDWVRIATMMGGANAGSFFMPDVNDEALVSFHHGDTQNPYVLGFFWNGQDDPPATDVRDRTLVSKNGHRIRFLDATPDGLSKGGIVLEDASGNRVIISDGKVVLQSKFSVEIEASTIYLQGPNSAWKRRVLPNNNAI